MVRLGTVAALVVAFLSTLGVPSRRQATRGSISGVIETDDGLLIVGARVTLESAGSGLERVVQTDGHGEFSFSDLPSGSYYLRASSSACRVAKEFGALSSWTGGGPIALLDHESLAGVRIVLARSSALAGMVRRPDGSGLPRASVEVLQLRTRSSGMTSWAFVAGTRSDDRGAYRVPGLAAGEYVLRVVPAETGSREGMAYVETYHPSALAAHGATTVGLEAGEQRTGNDIVMAMALTATITGRFLAGAGDTAVSGIDMRRVDGQDRNAARARVDVDLDLAKGQFTIRNAPPGQYLIRARCTAGGRQFWSQSVPVSVAGGDLSGILLPLDRGIHVTGTVEFAGAGLGRAVGAMTIALVPEPGGGGVASNAAVREDGTFGIDGVAAGAYRMTALVRPRYNLDRLARSPWAAETILVNGTDVVDQVIEIRSDVAVTVVLTDGLGGVAGRLTAPDDGGPYTVVAYPADVGSISSSSRRVAAVRPSHPRGEFAIPALPEGTYRLAVLEAVAPYAWLEPGFLAALGSGYVTVQVRDGISTVQDIQVHHRLAQAGDRSR